MQHFKEQALARGITETDLDDLCEELIGAIKRKDPEYIEFVMHGDAGVDYYRFRVEEGLFYALVGRGNNLVSIYTQEMVRQKKWAAKKKKHRSRRGDLKRR